MDIWENFISRNNHLILTGDYMQGFGGRDCSIEILEKLMELYNEEGVSLLLGNHEWRHISGEDIYKAGRNQTMEFKMQMIEKFGNEWTI